MSSKSDLFVAVDVGGTQIRAALCAPDGTILRRVADLTKRREGTGSVMDRIERAVRQVWPADGRVAGIGVAAPGPLDPWRGVILRCPNIPGWDNYPLRDIIKERLGIPAVIGDDANAAALAEQRYGVGHGKPNLVYLTISTGIGSGVIINNQLLLGAHGLAAEVGCMIIEPEGPLCSCGNRGCLEALASGPAIAREAKKRVRSGEASRILALVQGDVDEVTAKVVHQAAQQGDALAIDVLRRAGVYLGIGLVNLLHLLDPHVVVIGGSVSKAGDLLLEPARQVVRQRCLTEDYWRDTPIVPTALGDDVGLLGALCLALDTAGLAVR